jgi:hypothetical protein
MDRVALPEVGNRMFHLGSDIKFLSYRSSHFTHIERLVAFKSQLSTSILLPFLNRTNRIESNSASNYQPSTT